MGNIFSYLIKQGDKSFLDASFNEVDNLIFCAFSYIKLEEISFEREVFTIQDLYAQYKNIIKEHTIFQKNRDTLFYYLSKSKRFQDVKILNFVNEVSKEEEKQFGAMTFLLPTNQIFVAFRGTDETLTGWKEDFNLSYLDAIPSQERARQYLEKVLRNTDKEVFVGGHSKGGNLAMYAFLFCDKRLQNQVVKVYNDDGPGLQGDSFKESKKMLTFIPKASIVGHIFDPVSKIILIESSSIGVFQHDPYSWKVEENHFIIAKEIDSHTKKICHVLNDILNHLPNEKKENFINFLYAILTSMQVENIEESIQNIFNNSTLMKKYHFTLEDVALLSKIIPLFFHIVKSL